MNLETSFLDSIRESPGEASLWLILADWLEEQDDPRAELVRLTLALRTEPEHKEFHQRQTRVQALLAGGMKPLVPTFTNSVGIELALIPAGSFLMGSPEDEEGHSNNERQHPVRLTSHFYLGCHPVTNAQYRAAGGEVEHDPGDDYPVVDVSWENAVRFCQMLSALPAERAAGRVYRLPTEAEWEYACRAGTTTPFHFGMGGNSKLANFDGKRPSGDAERGPMVGRMTPIGTYPPNPWGLYDMHGNIINYCQDWAGRFRGVAVTDPTGPRRGQYRICRGGAWSFPAAACRAAYRNNREPVSFSDRVGFRVACDLVR
jgi:uncharacterized protein (TIGR02996 family)